VQETERMALRRANWPDVDDVVALCADADVMRHREHGLPMSAARVLAEEMPRLIAHSTRSDQLGCWIARDRATGEFLGWFSVIPANEPTNAVELGYRLRRRAWGKGYDIEGTLCMIEIARAAHVATVTATAMPRDLDYRRVIEMAGLRLTAARVADRVGPLALPGARSLHYALDLSAEAMLSA
jgi:RimJ/RimL family protein N-acetyltransferase